MNVCDIFLPPCDCAHVAMTMPWGELLRLVPCMLVWHHQKNIFFLLDRAKLKLKTSNIYVTMKKKHSGQAPTLLVLIWDLSQFWPCHTNMLGFFKSLLSRNFCSEICWECLKNMLLDIDEFQAEEASSLLILKAIFLSKCHTNILSWPIHELHKLRGNKVFCFWFFVSSMEATLSSTSNLIGWCFLFCPFTHFIWNCIYVTLTLAFYAWQRATYLGISFWYRNISSVLRVTFPGQTKWCKPMQNDVKISHR